MRVGMHEMHALRVCCFFRDKSDTLLRQTDQHYM